MRLVDLQMGFPSLLLALFILYVSGPGVMKVIFVLAVTRWMLYARITRSLMLALREEEFVQAARVIGASNGRIILRHMLPNLLSPLLVLATLEIATMILVEAARLPRARHSTAADVLGLMLSQGRAYITSAWWLVVFPGAAILITTLSLNLLAGWVRAVTDPVQRWRWLGRSRLPDARQGTGTEVPAHRRCVPTGRTASPSTESRSDDTAVDVDSRPRRP